LNSDRGLEPSLPLTTLGEIVLIAEIGHINLENRPLWTLERRVAEVRWRTGSVEITDRDAIPVFGY
ncbi:hypothetical protein, partial [Amycolatopsis thailandensis]|uniref:hypothetical protein n=1 Tax=Amycolatopsis thailandensis TaxID=589330 RepID=UPI001ABFED53